MKACLYEAVDGRDGQMRIRPYPHNVWPLGELKRYASANAIELSH